MPPSHLVCSKMSPEVTPLPLPNGPNQAYCEVSALEGGLLQMPDYMFVSTAKEGVKHLAPALAFLLTHTSSRTRLLFDLGIRCDTENAIASIRLRISEIFRTSVPQDVPASLAKGGLTPQDITHVLLSHCHWDHVGNPALFSSARFISVFPSDLLPEGRTDFLDFDSDIWRPIGPFPRAFDYFGDGSLYIVDCTWSSSGARWMYLAGDSAHDWRLIRGEAAIAVRHGDQCAHRDKEQAEATMKRIADLLTLPRVRAILAHDSEWFNENRGGDAFWPGKIISL
ncbi:Metallo-hydrolase/oxidoreductase [Phellopilus nigrolimitatus]|nr:Metallo-hydrolase/oxidoreductase [Phellopilus nigrolimitatus]